MPSPADLAALILAAAAPAQDAPPAGEGPRASSNEGERYDAVGYAGSSDVPAGVGHATLTLGRFVEVTALDTGRTALFAITGTAPAHAGEPIALSADAMRQLGLSAPGAPVRVRIANPSPPEIAALRAGRPAGDRLTAPEVLLVGLRKDLPPRGTAAAAVSPALSPAPVRPPQPIAKPAASQPAARPVAAPKAAPVPVSGWGVQVAALSDAARAKALAAQLGGRARPTGNLWRIQLGPFADRAKAEAARADIARRGHPGATIVRLP